MDRNKRDGTADYSTDTIEESDKCEHCGERSHKTERVCPHCGKRKDKW